MCVMCSNKAMTNGTNPGNSTATHRSLQVRILVSCPSSPHLWHLRSPSLSLMNAYAPTLVLQQLHGAPETSLSMKAVSSSCRMLSMRSMAAVLSPFPSCCNRFCANGSCWCNLVASAAGTDPVVEGEGKD